MVEDFEELEAFITTEIHCCEQETMPPKKTTQPKCELAGCKARADPHQRTCRKHISVYKRLQKSQPAITTALPPVVPEKRE